MKQYSQMTVKELTAFINEQAKICMGLAKQCADGEFLTRFVECREKAVRYEYGKSGWNIFHRGIYYPSEISPLIVTNCGVGKSLKRPPSGDDKEYYRYSFDEGGRLVMTERFNCDYGTETEYIIDIDDVEYGICYGGNAIREIFAAKYNEHGLEYCYDFILSTLGFEYCEFKSVCLFDYEENGRKYAAVYFPQLLRGWRLIADRKYFYQYDESGKLIGVYDEMHPQRIIPFEKSKTKRITPKQVVSRLEKLINAWEDEDIYAVSVYCENCGDIFTVSAGYNTEQNFEENCPDASDDTEARWNYAFWLQNEEPLFDIEAGFDSEDSSIKPAADLLIKAVKQLHKSGIIAEKFGGEIPVIIHELEYYPYVARVNIEANGRKLLPEDFIDFCGGEEDYG